MYIKYIIIITRLGEQNMVIAKTHFELQLSNNILFRPFRIIFEKKNWVSGQNFIVTGLLSDFTSFYNMFEFFYYEAQSTLSTYAQQSLMTWQKGVDKKRKLTFFMDQTVVSVVGIICITKTTMGELEFEEFVAAVG